MNDPAALAAALAATGFWSEDAGALAIDVDGRLVGTVQFYRTGPGVHGYEIGYILHGEADRGKGYASDALRLFGDLLLAERPRCHRLQLIIETWNDASARLAEACGYQREGVLRRAGYSSDVPEDCFVYSRVRE
jgi:ribosomal-protein-alanine N-acetyltransferase